MDELRAEEGLERRIGDVELVVFRVRQTAANHKEEAVTTTAVGGAVPKQRTVEKANVTPHLSDGGKQYVWCLHLRLAWVESFLCAELDWIRRKADRLMGGAIVGPRQVVPTGPDGCHDPFGAEVPFDHSLFDEL